MSLLKARSSFRDPSGHIFTKDGAILRQVNLAYKDHYDAFISSGLYKTVAGLGLVIRHEEVDLGAATKPDVYKVLKPEAIPFISYPYEWSFSQLKDAALATLEIQKISLEHGLTLKDSSAYNIQWLRGKPVLIDTLSFEKYREGEPWVAYKQFCQHFLAPLALMSYRHVGLSQLLRANVDGITLEVARSVLPMRTHLRPSLKIHIHLHARAQQRFADKPDARINRGLSGRFSRRAFLGLIDSLESAVKRLRWKPSGTEWSDYSEDGSYSSEALDSKIALVTQIIEEVKPATLWDFGANIGRFSRIATDMGIDTVSFDADPAAVEKNYLISVGREDTRNLSLLCDLTNPSPGIGWDNRERMDLEERGPADMVLALALIHHFAIGANVPFVMIAEFLSKLCGWALVEFIPKTDHRVQRMLSTREDVFPRYNQEAFEADFSKFFELRSVQKIVDSERTLYLMRRSRAC